MKRRKPQPRRRRWPAILLLILAAAAAGAGTLYLRPLPALAARPSASQPPATTVTGGKADITWPSYGQSAVGAVGYGPMDVSGPQTPLPTASVAKVMTALTVLDKHPLQPGETGPMITMDQDDVDIYNWYIARDGVVANIEVGEQISQYDLLQAALMRSANNMADKLAIWAFGSVDAYSAYANKYAQAHGMTHTTITSASGYAPTTVSTASDLVQMGSLAMQNSVIAKIVGTRQATIPVAGTIGNVNGLIGKHGINGIKPGSIDEAGGVFLASADRELADGSHTTVIAAVMGGTILDRTMLDSVPLLDAAAANLRSETVAHKGDTLGTYTAPWSGQSVQTVAGKDLSILTWPGGTVTSKVNFKPLQGRVADGDEYGTITASSFGQTAEVPLTLQGNVAVPAARWRLYDRFAADLAQSVQNALPRWQ